MRNESRPSRLEGGAIPGAAALLMALLVATALGLEGATRAGVREVVAWSTRFGAVAFAASFVARPLHARLATPSTKWLLRNRRYLGLAFAVMHFTHLAALGTMMLAFPAYFDAGVDAVTLYGGGLVYVLLTAMTITSFDGPAKRIGRRAWRRLHTTGAWALWGVFTLNYVGATVEIGASYAPLALLLVAALGVRVWDRLAGSSRAGAAPAAG